ncbi:MAG TPA: hypothetical protein VNO84_01865 [Burkholderiaceae bacterium]|nr:hypothetical protein [Burkholderiaceae bacterium]
MDFSYSPESIAPPDAPMARAHPADGSIDAPRDGIGRIEPGQHQRELA